MLGAIFGDIVGSPYEFDEYNLKSTEFPLLSERSDFTDDTVMTIAVAKALMDSYGMDDETIKIAVSLNMQVYGRDYPDRGYGGRFGQWLKSNDPKPYGSYGNGSAMRVAAAGWLYQTLPETLHAAELTAVVTHDHPEGIKGAQAVAAAIFLSRARMNKDDMRAYLAKEFGYDLYRTLDEIRPDYHMDETCQGSVPEAILAFLEGQGYVDVVRKAVSIGGDSDTIACIAGSIAEAYYGMPEHVEKMAFQHIPPEFRAVVYRFREFYREHSGRPLPGWESAVYPDAEQTLKALTALELSISDFYIKSGQGNNDPNNVLDELLKLMEHGASILVPVDKAPKFRGTGDRDENVNMLCIQDTAGNVLLPAFTSRKELGTMESNEIIFSSLSDVIETAYAADNVFGVILNPFGQNFMMDQHTLEFLMARQSINKKDPD